MSICVINDACTKNKYYSMISNYWYENYYYFPNPENTCINEWDTLYNPNIPYNDTSFINYYYFMDCCANSRNECRLRYFDSKTPTSSPTLSMCSLKCEKHFYMDKCYFFENPVKSLTCDLNGNFKCCINERSKCCKVNENIIFIFSVTSLSCIFLTIIVVFYYHYKNINRKIYTENQMKSILPIHFN